MQQGLLGRISRSSIMEYHAFGIISYLQRFRTWNFTDCNINAGSDQEKTFGPTISSLIHRHIGPERLLLWDSKKRGGRPDTMKILKEVYHYWGAEVVFITSNYIGNSEIMEGCKEAGIPAFGTLWDFPAKPTNAPQLTGRPSRLFLSIVAFPPTRRRVTKQAQACNDMKVKYLGYEALLQKEVSDIVGPSVHQQKRVNGSSVSESISSCFTKNCRREASATGKSAHEGDGSSLGNVNGCGSQMTEVEAHDDFIRIIKAAALLTSGLDVKHEECVEWLCRFKCFWYHCRRDDLEDDFVLDDTVALSDDEDQDGDVVDIAIVPQDVDEEEGHGADAVESIERDDAKEERKRKRKEKVKEKKLKVRRPRLLSTVLHSTPATTSGASLRPLIRKV
ncbi:feruloyl-coa synthetase protein [Salix suchowensis]|nr:feruloyl-coa synthetase protein [Salix suchowensis]